MEKLDHGLLAIYNNSGVFVSWRVLASEWDDVAYNIYRDGILITPNPISQTSNLLDAEGTTESVYELKRVIKGVVENKTETTTTWANNYLEIPVREISLLLAYINLHRVSFT